MNNSKVNSVMAVNLEFKETPSIKQGRVFMDLSCQGGVLVLVAASLSCLRFNEPLLAFTSSSGSEFN